MAQIPLCGKLKTEIEMKVPAATFHVLISCRTYEISKADPGNVISVDLLDGQWGQQGSVVRWNYFLNGKRMSDKAIVESIDDKNYSCSFRMIEGSSMEHYKSLNVHCQAIPKSGSHSVVRFIVDYEKVNEYVPDPQQFIDLLFQSTMAMDTYLTKA